MNLRPPRYQRGAHTGPGSWSMVGQAGLEPAIPCSQSRWDGRFPTTRCVPAPGLEPGCPAGHGVLSAARLPDSARRAYLIQRADDRPRTGYLLHGKQVRVHMRIIRVHGFTAVSAGGAAGYRTPPGMLARQTWTPVPAPSYPPRESNPHVPKDTAPSTRSVYRSGRWVCFSCSRSCSRWESNPHATGAPLLEGGASAGSATRASVPPAGLEPASSRLRTGRP